MNIRRDESMDKVLIWPADPMEKVFKDDSPAGISSPRVCMETARGAIAAGQLAVKPVNGETLQIEPFRLKEGGGSEVTILPRFVGFVLINVNTPDTPVRPISRCPLSGEIDREAPCKIPDPLLETDRMKVEPGETQPIWLTADIPPDQKPGIYRGEFRLNISDRTENIPVELTVYGAVVPAERHLTVVNHLRPEPLAEFYDVAPWSEEHWRILRSFADSMATHRQNMINVPIFSLLRTIKSREGLSFDFSLFDRFIELFIEAGVVGKVEGTTLAGSNRKEAYLSGVEIRNTDDNTTYRQGQFNIHSSEARTFLKSFLPALEKHIGEKGWLDIYLQRIFDEPRDEDAADFRFLSGMVKSFAPKLRRMEPILSIDLEDSLEVWIPPLEHFEGGIGFDRYQPFFEKLKDEGKEVWFYECFSPRGSYPNRFLDFPLVKQRVVHWINFKYDLPGFLHWGYNGSSKIWGRLYWNYRNEFCCGIQKECYAPGDAFIVYPGKEKPMSCLRYEIHRKSIEDYELLKSLSDKDPVLAREIADSVLPSITGYERRIAKFNSNWKRLVEALS
jgi:hypothetical protein